MYKKAVATKYILTTFVFLLIFQSYVQSAEVWAPERDGYLDTNKTGNADSNLCWAVVASNILEWGDHRWSFDDPYSCLVGVDPELTTAAQNNDWLNYYKSHWTNESFDCDLALRWLFEGIDTSQSRWFWWTDYGDYGAQLESPGGASYSEGTYGLTYIEEPGVSTPVQIQNFLTTAPVGISINYEEAGEYHVITCYGIRYVDVGGGGVEYQGLYYTDGDTDNTQQGNTEPLDNGGVMHYQAIIEQDGSWFLAYSDNITATHEIMDLTTLAPAIVPTVMVTPRSSLNGSIEPDTPFTVEYEGDKTFTADPYEGYKVDYWMVDYSDHSEMEQLGGETYTQENITEDITVTVYFKEKDDEPEPFGDLVVLSPASSPHTTGDYTPYFLFRVPDGTDHIGWYNHEMGYGEDDIEFNNQKWHFIVDVQEGENNLTFTAYNASGTALASTNFVVNHVENMRMVRVEDSECSWAWVYQGDPGDRYEDEGIRVGWSNYNGIYGWEYAVVKFDLPPLPGRVLGSTIEADFLTKVYEFISEGSGNCGIRSAAIHSDWQFDVTNYSWNTRPGYDGYAWVTGTDSWENIDFDEAGNETEKREVTFEAGKAVSDWYNGVRPNKGFLLWPSGDPFDDWYTSDPTLDRYFNGSDFRLTIEYKYNTDPPTLNITSPANNSTVTNATTSVTVSGTASDNSSTSISNVTWRNNTTGTSGAASGTSSWSCTVDLAVGENQIAITAKDVVDNTASQIIIVNRSEPDTSPPNNPTNCSSKPLLESIKLLWQNTTDIDFEGVVILRSDNPISATLTSGSTCTVGSTIDDAIVVYVGSSNSFVDHGLIPYEEYHYAIYSFDDSLNYSGGVALFGVPYDMAGDGTAESPYEISSLDDLLIMKDNSHIWDKHFLLTENIDMAGYVSEHSFIGNFSGVFNGNGNKITNLTIEFDLHSGFFNLISSEGEVNNIGIENCSVNGLIETGGLAGRNAGTISNSYVIGSITGRYYEGGLVGLNSGTIINCYARGSVSGPHPGGLCGYNDGTVSNCYSTGTVYGGDDPGGLVGYGDGIINDSFWDVETSGITGGMGLATSQMYDMAMFVDAGWDFSDTDGNAAVWKMRDGYGYPLLACQEYLMGDFAGDYSVNLIDFAIFAASWMSQAGDITFNIDCDLDYIGDSNDIIDLADLTVFSENWLKELFGDSLLVEGLTPPVPNPAIFTLFPISINSTTIAMTATKGLDASGPVEYYFAELSGNPGGDNSDWQLSETYIDRGLEPNTEYTYTVQMRDSVGNYGTVSDPASATNMTGTEFADGNAYFSFDNLDDPAHDDSSNGYNGILVGGTLSVPSRTGLGQALSFDGEDDRVDGFGEPLYTNDFSVSAWFNADGNIIDEQVIVAQCSFSNSHIRFSIGVEGNKLCFQQHRDTGEIKGTGETSIPYGAWYHVAFISDINGFRVYLNGELDGNIDNSEELFGSENQGMVIGAKQWQTGQFNRHFEGMIDEVKIFDRALTELEIQSLYVNP